MTGGSEEVSAVCDNVRCPFLKVSEGRGLAFQKSRFSQYMAYETM